MTFIKKLITDMTKFGKQPLFLGSSLQNSAQVDEVSQTIKIIVPICNKLTTGWQDQTL